MSFWPLEGEVAMKPANLDAARAFLAECDERGISVLADREDWRLRVWGPLENAGWVAAHHHFKADVLALLTGSPELYLDAE
jgi:hypothetical protein